MDYIIASFRSRAHTIKFYHLLRANGVNAELINTPKEAGVGCGLSVKISKNVYPQVKRAILNANLNSYAGSFLVNVVKGGKTVRNAF